MKLNKDYPRIVAQLGSVGLSELLLVVACPGCCYWLLANPQLRLLPPRYRVMVASSLRCNRSSGGFFVDTMV
jgi:hypothetical protein